MPDVFQSSDSTRGAAPLRHAHTVRFPNPLRLERGGLLPGGIDVAYESYGSLSADRDNAILICHALSGDSHVARHDPHDDPGWWDLVVGPGKPIDTDRYFVLCANILGGCRGTTGPNSINPDTNKPYGSDFPVITVGDIARVQLMLLDHLGIDKLLAVVGGSLGGHQALTLATLHPHRVAATLAIATSPRLTSQALAFDVVGRNAILSDPHYHDGRYQEHDDRPTTGLAIARMLGHITYLSQEAMTEKFDPDRFRPRDVATAFEKKFSVGSYLAHQGDRFVERFDANSYITLSMAMDLFDLANLQPPSSPPTPTTETQAQALPCLGSETTSGGDHLALTRALAPTTCRWLVLSFSSDWLFPSFQSRQIVNALIALGKPVTYCDIRSTCGHDAFLLQDDLPVYGRMIADFLHHTAQPSHPKAQGLPPLGPSASSTSPPLPITAPPALHRRRIDLDLLLELIPPDASVLDLGCGEGGLAAKLLARGQKRVMGIELDQSAIVHCVAAGLDVVQADLNRRLPAFTDRQFDLVVVSHTLQSIENTKGLVDEILRIGHSAVV
ncbi:MAG: homoserine O-acetyltransferase, partial [Phycisphaeraceae bacterium]|nr:homoserine O-acetyltransferase [Phycisphaeraceae bacterium]